MATTVLQALDRAQRFVHWNKAENWPPEFDRLPAANEAGEWLSSIEQWNWLRRPSVLLSLTANQSYITLPSDFGRFISIAPERGGAIQVVMEDEAAVDRARTGLPSGGALFRGAILHSSPSAAAAPVARLELGPVPTVSVSNALRLSYFAGWLPVASESAVVPVPTWMVPVYVRALAVIMSGWEREAKGDVEDRLDKLVRSSLFMAAVERDQTLQSDLGPVRNTAEAQVAGGEGEVYMSGTNGVLYIPRD